MKTRWLIMPLLMILIGWVSAAAAALLHVIIGFTRHALFLKTFSASFNPDLHTAVSPFGNWVMFAPVIGGLIVMLIFRFLCKGEQGHGGVGDVLHAIAYEKSHLTWRSGLRAIASAITIGSGGSLGREGPVMMLTGVISEYLASFAGMIDRNLLLSASAAAALASTFSAPIAGIAFAIELVFDEIDLRKLVYVSIAAISGAYIYRMLYGFEPTFGIFLLGALDLKPIPLASLLTFIPLGVLVGLSSALLNYSLLKAEIIFDKIQNMFIRHLLAMFVLGLMLIGFFKFAGHYYIDGIGFATIKDCLAGVLEHPELLIVLFIGKLLATTLTYSSGAPGGMFSPCLFLGAVLGALFYICLKQMMPAHALTVSLFVIAAMAAFLGSATGAILTAIALAFEQTHAFMAFLPIMVAISTACLVRLSLMKDNIYTLKFTHIDEPIPLNLVRSHA